MSYVETTTIMMERRSQAKIWNKLTDMNYVSYKEDEEVANLKKKDHLKN
jgi:hypothetical protein